MKANAIGRVSVLLSIGVLIGACRSARETAGPPEKGRAEPSVPTGAARLDATRPFVEPVAIENLTVWPIVAERFDQVGEYLALKEAQERGLAVVRETENGGEVNSLMVENNGDLPILICGGTVVKGGKQDRQIAQDFVVAPKSKVAVEAFCIEAGRWTGSRAGLATLGFFEATGAVAALPVRTSAQYQKSQEAVWSNVSAINTLAAKAPATGTYLATLEETDPQTIARRAKLKESVLDRFRALRAQGAAVVGFAYAVNGKPVAVRAFADPKLCQQHLQPFLEAMALEAELARAGASGAPPASIGEVVRMVRELDQAKEEITETRAANRNGLRRSAAGGNLNCYVERGADPRGAAERSWVPLTQDWSRTDGAK